MLNGFSAIDRFIKVNRLFQATTIKRLCDSLRLHSNDPDALSLLVEVTKLEADWLKEASALDSNSQLKDMVDDTLEKVGITRLT